MASTGSAIASGAVATAPAVAERTGAVAARAGVPLAAVEADGDGDRGLGTGGLDAGAITAGVGLAAASLAAGAVGRTMDAACAPPPRRSVSMRSAGSPNSAR